MTFLWNDLTLLRNDLTWEDLTMERSDRIPPGFKPGSKIPLTESCLLE